MIGYLEGTLLKSEEERILLLAGQVGYEVLLPGFVSQTLRDRVPGDPLSFYIYYHQTERQPTPTLIGFHSEEEKEFFLLFISVEAIGPLKAVKALNRSFSEIAEAIESGNVNGLKLMKGIGARTAQKIIATLRGRMGKFALTEKIKTPETGLSKAVIEQVMTVLVEQLGHKASEARTLIDEAIERSSSISTPEELFDEIYRRPQS
jgi:Holliday junction DNA helicase RuvA